MTKRERTNNDLHKIMCKSIRRVPDVNKQDKIQHGSQVLIFRRCNKTSQEFKYSL
jgi:hypothetical protein